MYTKESPQRTFEMPNNNLDAKLVRAYQNDDNEILRNQKEEQDKSQFMMVNFQNVMILMYRTPFDQYQISSAVL